jgi:hypothetical protein
MLSVKLLEKLAQGVVENSLADPLHDCEIEIDVVHGKQVAENILLFDHV